MKRIEQLRPLSREHHASLVLASKAINAAKSNDPEEISQLCEQIANDFDQRWNSHFQKEEQAIFSVLEANYNDKLQEKDAALSELLSHQHNQMRDMAEEMRAGNTNSLASFGLLLKEHTRLEERVLFPLISSLFNKSELDNILI